MDKDIILVETAITKDTYHQEYPQEIGRKNVFGEKNSVGRDEFYKAGQSGYKASCCIKLWKYDYNKEHYLICDGICYHVYRTYDVNEMVELYCEETNDLEVSDAKR